MQIYNLKDPDFESMIKKTVVQSNGKPDILFHGTKCGGFESFDTETGSKSEAATNGNDCGLGIFWTKNRKHAVGFTQNNYLPPHEYNPYLYSAAISIENPFVVKDDELNGLIDGSPSALRQELLDKGHDGLIIECGGWNEYVTFHDHQVLVLKIQSGRELTKAADVDVSLA